MEKISELTVVKGNSFFRTASVTENDLPVDLSDSSIQFMVKAKQDDADADALIAKVITNGDVNGTFSISLTPSETNITPNTYWYEIRYDKTPLVKVTYSIGNFIVKNNLIKA